MGYTSDYDILEIWQTVVGGLAALVCFLCILYSVHPLQLFPDLWREVIQGRVRFTLPAALSFIAFRNFVVFGFSHVDIPYLWPQSQVTIRCLSPFPLFYSSPTLLLISLSYFTIFLSIPDACVVQGFLNVFSTNLISGWIVVIMANLAKGNSLAFLSYFSTLPPPIRKIIMRSSREKGHRCARWSVDAWRCDGPERRSFYRSFLW